MPILVVTKLLCGNHIQFMPIYRIKKVPSKILYFGHSVDQNKGAYSYMVGPNPKTFI